MQVALVSGFPTQLALGALLIVAGLPPWDEAGGLSLAYIVTLLLLDSAVVLGLIWTMLRLHGEQPAPLFLGVRPPGREALAGLLLVPVIVAATVALMALLRAVWPGLHNVTTNPFESAIGNTVDAVILGVAAVIGGGLKEELQRAFILRRFGQSLGGAPLGLGLYSLLFGAGHAMQGWDVGIVTAGLGLFWGLLYLRRRSAVAPIVSHGGFNAAQIVQFAVFGS
jgi:membrane protease YdiL (CAAX protease family)